MSLVEGLIVAPPNCDEVGVLQVDLDGAVGETLVQQPPTQRSRTKLIFDIFFDDYFWTDGVAEPVEIFADVVEIT